MHCWVHLQLAAACVDLHRPQTKTLHMCLKSSSDIFGCPAPFLCKTLPISLHCLYQACNIINGGVLWYMALKCLWTCVCNFILIKHSTHTVPSLDGSWQIGWWFTHSHIQMQCNGKQGALPSTRYSVKLWDFLSQMIQNSMSVCFLKASIHQ